MKRVEATAMDDKDSVLLKRVLSYGQEDYMPCLGNLLSRIITSIGNGNPLTNFKQAIVLFCGEQDLGKRYAMRKHLEAFVRCFIRMRTYHKLPLMEHIGYHPQP